MHVLQLLPRFLVCEHVEVVLLRSPNAVRSVFANQMFDDGIAPLLKVIEQTDTRTSLPFLLEQTQLASLAEPDQGVNVFGHHHEHETETVVLGSHRFEVMNHDPLASVLIQELPTGRTREREKVRMTGIIEDSTTNGGDSPFGGKPTPRHVAFLRVARLASSRVRQHKKLGVGARWSGTLVLVQRS